MTDHHAHPLSQALAAWSRNTNGVDEINRRQRAFDDAVALGETGVFSNRHIAHITGLDPSTVDRLTSKTDKTGGRFTPEALPFLHDIWLQWVQAGTCDSKALLYVVELGVSPRMVSKLTGIGLKAIYYRLGKVS